MRRAVRSDHEPRRRDRKPWRFGPEPRRTPPLATRKLVLWRSRLGRRARAASRPCVPPLRPTQLLDRRAAGSTREQRSAKPTSGHVGSSHCWGEAPRSGRCEPLLTGTSERHSLARCEPMRNRQVAKGVQARKPACNQRSKLVSPRPLFLRYHLREWSTLWLSGQILSGMRLQYEQRRAGGRSRGTLRRVNAECGVSRIEVARGLCGS